MSAIHVDKLTKTFRGSAVFRELSLRVEPGCATALIGPSGAGKSTLLRCIIGLTPFDSGRVAVGDAVLSGSGPEDAERARAAGQADALRAIRRRVGLVLQGLHLFAHRTALENVTEAPIHVRGRSPEDAAAQARELLALVGLGHREEAYPAELSGGEQQRVAIARALAMEPEVLLLDEPTSALDPGRRREVARLLRDLGERRKVTVVVVTHEMSFARDVSDRTCVLADGGVVEEGPTEELFRAPRHDRTRALFAEGA